MTDNRSRDTADEFRKSPDPQAASGDPFCSGIPASITLESIVDLTGEFEHLNSLVQLHLERSGGFTCMASYFTIVTPLLDMLEVEIRFRYRDGMTKDQIKLIVQDWIDGEIAGLNHGT
jgi:hypothetical protein